MPPDLHSSLHPTALKVQERLQALGLDVEVQVLPDSTRTAADAATACGCELGRIVKSLAFCDAASGEPVMCLRAGDRQVPTEELVPESLYGPRPRHEGRWRCGPAPA